MVSKGKASGALPNIKTVNFTTEHSNMGGRGRMKTA